MTYDAVIIGGGPAGLTAAIYALRRELKVLIIAKAIGGQAAIAHEVENWPGTKSISGFDLTNNMQQQVVDLGGEFVSNEVIGLEKSGEEWLVKTNTENYNASTVILAFGLTPRDLAFARGLRGAVPHLRCPGLLADRGLESRRPPLGARCCAFSRPVSVENYDGA